MNTTTTSKNTAPRIAWSTGWVAWLALVLAVLALTIFAYTALRPAQPVAVSPMAADHSYDDIEAIRSSRGALVPIAATADHSYDDIERIRSARARGVR